MALAWRSSCITDVGRVRSNNEDAYLEKPKLGLWLVADGMGGHAAGDVASQIVVGSLDDVLQVDSLQELSFVVKSKLSDANRQILSEARERPGNVVMGATVVALIARDDVCCCLWAGDSRAYLLRERELSQLTRDHSVVESLIGSGQLRREDASNHPQAEAITRAVGAEDALNLDEQCYNLEEGDIILLCSDGLNKEMPDQEIAQVLSENDYKSAAALLIETSLDRGSRDNVTVAVVEFFAEEDTTVTM